MENNQEKNQIQIKSNEDLSQKDQKDLNEKLEKSIQLNFSSKFPEEEIREWEQYFFTEKVLSDLSEALEYEEDILCLCTPALSDYFFRKKNRVITCLDIDRRFEYLPGFVYFDILKPEKINFKPKVIVVDPPFFKMNLMDLYRTILLLTEGDFAVKIIFAFVKREDKGLLTVFKDFGLQLTKFRLEYRTVDASKWDNYGIYSNFESRKIKFFDKKTKENSKGGKNKDKKENYSNYKGIKGNDKRK